MSAYPKLSLAEMMKVKIPKKSKQQMRKLNSRRRRGRSSKPWILREQFRRESRQQLDASIKKVIAERKKGEAADEVSKGSPALSPPRPTNRKNSDSKDDINFGNPSTVKEKPKKALAKKAPAKPKADKPTKLRAKKPANSDSEDEKPAKKKRTKKGEESDSEDDFNLSSLGGDDES